MTSMIKKLTIALLLFATGTLFAQNTAPIPTTFLVLTEDGREADMALITLIASVTIGQTSGNYIQDTLDAVLDSAITDLVDTGGEIFIKGGTYYISASDSIMLTGADTVARPIYIVGEPGKTIINITCNTGSKFAFVSVAARMLCKLNFRNIEFVGDANALGLLNVGQASGDSITVSNCIIRDFTNASATIFSVSDSADNWIIEDCRFKNNQLVQFNGQYSIFRDCFFDAEDGNALDINGDHNIVEGCEIRGLTANKYFISVLEQGSGSTVEGMIIRDNVLTAADSTGDTRAINIAANCNDALIINNFIGNPSLGKKMIGYGVVGFGARSRIINNYIYGAVATGINSTSTGDNSMIMGNPLDNCTAGIVFDATNTKSGHTENFFLDVGTNVTDNGTNTVNGDTRDLD